MPSTGMSCSSGKSGNYADMKAKPFNPKAADLVLKANGKVGVLLIHGLTGMPNEMKPIAKQLEEIGCKIAVPMLDGHDGSYKDLLKVKWTDWLATCRQSVNELSKTCDKIVVGGLSMGGLLGVMLALENPKINGVVALSPTIDYDGENSNIFRHLLPLVDIAPGFLGKIFYWTEEAPYGLKDPRLQRIITKKVEEAKKGGGTDFGQFRTYAGSLRELQRLIGTVKKQGKSLKVPVLIIHSLEDTITTGKNALTLYSWLPNSADKEIIWMEGCDHVLTLDLKKEEVAYHFAAFTAKVTADAKVPQLVTA